MFEGSVLTEDPAGEERVTWMHNWSISSKVRGWSRFLESLNVS